MQKLTIITKELPDYSNAYLMTFDGDFDGYAKEDVVKVQDFIDRCKDKTDIVFDFTKLNYLNSYAIGHLIDWNKRIAETGGTILIAGTPKSVGDIFTILGIDTLFKFYKTSEAAIKDLK